MIFLVDTSAFHRSGHPTVSSKWSELLARDELATCEQTRLEILWSAKNASDYDELAEELLSLRQLPTDVEAFQRALEVQQLLAHTGGLHHRSVKIADLLIAATAELHGATVLHYDQDFDRVTDITGQPTEWITTRGSI